MFPAVLEVVISLVVVYFLMSTLVSFCNELIAMVVNSRGKILYKSLQNLLDESKEDDDSFISKIYKSKFVNHLSSKFSIANKINKKPSYIGTENFASALIDEIQKGVGKKSYARDFDELKKKIEALKDSFIKTKLQEIITELEETQQASITAIKKKISEWYDSYMLTVTEVYKNYVRFWIFGISFFITFAMNIDSLVLIEYFYENKEKREVMISFAENVGKDDYKINDSLTGDARVEEIKKLKKVVVDDFNAFDLPYGWKKGMSNTLQYEKKVLNNPTKDSSFKKIIGLFLTTISLTLGAPFWYQLMVNLLALRKSIVQNKSS
jgi:hypothetical protein